MAGQPVVGVFASDKGPGDAERSTIMSQAGTYLARKGASLVCLAEEGDVLVPLIISARAAKGEVTLIADPQQVLPASLRTIRTEQYADQAERLSRVASLCDVLVGLPGSLASARELFITWTYAKAIGRKPVVLLNRNRAFEVLWGLSADILSHSMRDHDRHLQFADNVEDLWARIARLTGAPG